MSHALESPRYRLAAAKEQLAEFQGICNAYFNDSPCTTFTEDDPDTGLHIDKARFVTPLPVRLVTIAAQIVEHLRSALDQTCKAIAKSSGAGVRKCHFPFSETAADLDAVMRKQSRGLPDEIVGTIRTFKPYKGGNDTLWGVNFAANTNKHDLLIPVGFFTGELTYQKFVSTGGPLSIPYPVWDRSKNEMVIVRYAGAQPEYSINLRLLIEFKDIAAFAQRNAIQVLMSMHAEVQRVVDSLADEATRIGVLS
jgi:hypothetical protein